MTRAHLRSISEDEPMAYDSDFSEETTQTVLSNAASTVSSASTSSSTSCRSSIDTVRCSDDSTEHMVLLDWDDTLMPTTYLLAHIDYEINAHSQKIETFSINGKLHGSPEDLREFVANLDKAGQAALDLLSKIFLTFKASNVKIVTNGVRGWLPESLFVAGSFSNVYQSIERLMSAQGVEIIYARDYNIDSASWKTKSFDKILWSHFNDDNSNQQESAHTAAKNMNVITIGDQWTDHESVAQCLTYYVYGESMSHHQLKLLPAPDCRYLAIELNYIAELLQQTILFEFHLNAEAKAHGQKGVVLEFDGYNEDEAEDEENENEKDNEEEAETAAVSD